MGAWNGIFRPLPFILILFIQPRRRFIFYTRHVMCKVALHIMGRFWKKVLCEFKTTFSHVKEAPQASLYVEEASLMLFLSFGWSIVDSILTLPMSFSCMYACS
jgi:hypothetical protein